MIPLLALIMAIAVAATLWAESGHPSWRRILKMAAATVFLVVAITAGALDTTFGKVMLLGLALAWVGDLALTYSGRKAFVSGLVAFLSAHVAYGVAFAIPATGGSVERSIDWSNVIVGAVVLTGLGLVVARWLLPTVPRDLVIPVIAYVVVISAMVALAAGHVVTCPSGCRPADGVTILVDRQMLDWRIVLGAVLFYVSDLAVARDRFVAPGSSNRMWGLPAYFAGQFLLAWSAGGPL